MRITTIIVIVVLLSACSTVHSGKVMSKNYTEAYSYTTVEPLVRSGRKGNRTTISVPVTHYVPARYSIVIEGKDKDGEIGTNTINLTASEYTKYEVGDWYPARSNGGEIK